MTAINKDFRVKNGIVAGGNVSAVSFIGDGSQLTGISIGNGIPDHSITFQKLAPANFTYSTYVGDGFTLDYTLAQATETPEQLFVFVASVPQTPGSSYTVNGTTLSFTSAPPLGSNIVVRYYGTPLPYQTNVDWNATSGSAEILNKPVLFSGSYVDLTNKPTLFSGSYVDLTDKPTLFSGAYSDLTGKPTLFSGSYNDLTDKPTIPSLTGYATETYVNTQIASVVNSAPTTLDTLNELATALGNDANFATTVSTQLGLKANTSSLATVAFSGSYNDLLNKPSFSVLSSVSTLAFDTSYTGATPVAQLSWNSGDGTLDLGLLGGNVVLQVGQEQVQRINNNTGATLLEGQAVYITGAQGQRLTVALAQANAESTSSKTFGVVTENIVNGLEGYITTEGLVRNINTSAYAEGAALWLSPTSAGGLTTTKPSAPNHLVLVGFCVRQHASAGSIFVKVQNGYELDELHDVSINGKTNNDFLRYDSATGTWKNAQLSSSNVTTALGFTPYNSTNPNGYISSITSSNVTTALGYTPATAAQVQAANDNAVAMAIALG